jgi:hypothetical protein
LPQSPQLILKVVPAEKEPKAQDYDPAELPSLYSRARTYSSSSRGGSEYDIPIDTDYEDRFSDHMEVDDDELPTDSDQVLYSLR